MLSWHRGFHMSVTPFICTGLQGVYTSVKQAFTRFRTINVWSVNESYKAMSSMWQLQCKSLNDHFFSPLFFFPTQGWQINSYWLLCDRLTNQCLYMSGRLGNQCHRWALHEVWRNLYPYVSCMRLPEKLRNQCFHWAAREDRNQRLLLFCRQPTSLLIWKCKFKLRM